MKDFTNLDQPTGRIISKYNEEYLFFGGTAYLGLLTNQEHMNLYIQGIRQYGLNNGTSRNNNVQLNIYDEAEKCAAARFKFEDSILLSSGYLAAQLVIKELSNAGKVYYAPNCHPALWLNDDPNVTALFADWIKALVLEINASVEEFFIIISNTLDNMTPELYDFSELLKIRKSKNVLLILDDSHGIATVRKNQVTVDHSIFKDTTIEVLVLASLAKGLGTDAGVILGKNNRIKELRKSTFFTGASPASPAALYAFVKSEEIYERQFDKLQRNIIFFRNLIGDRVRSVTNFPVFTSDDPTLYQYLENKGFLVSSFHYPLSTDPLLNRIVISSLHDEVDLKKLAEVLIHKK